jgi:hypothetical protein
MRAVRSVAEAARVKGPAIRWKVSFWRTLTGRPDKGEEQEVWAPRLTESWGALRARSMRLRTLEPAVDSATTVELGEVAPVAPTAISAIFAAVRVTVEVRADTEDAAAILAKAERAEVAPLDLF